MMDFPEMAAMTSTRKILIVDDDAELREIAARTPWPSCHRNMAR